MWLYLHSNPRKFSARRDSRTQVILKEREVILTVKNLSGDRGIREKGM